MKIIVAGSRTYKNHQVVYAVLDVVVQKGDVVLQGGAPGVDRIAKTWARTHGIACQEFTADWDAFGTAAGRLRNVMMAKIGDALIAFSDGESPGTNSMIQCMQRAGKPIQYVYHDAKHPEAAMFIPF